MTDTKTSLPAPISTYDLFVFGDSLSDIGNLFKKTGLPPAPYKDGRFSNGSLAPEILAGDLGLEISLATNFAIGGAYSGRQNVNDSSTVKFGGVLDQIDQFKPQVTALGADAQDLYLVWAGGNDLLNIPPTATPDQIQTIVSNAVTNVTTAVTALAQSGAKNILVVQAGNLGRVPIVLQQGPVVVNALTTLTQTFNSGLETAMTALETSTPGVNVILSNLFPTTESVVQNPASFGFSNVNSSYLATLSSNPSANVDQFFFWDSVHPTTRGHGVFADTLEASVIAGITEGVTRIGTAEANILVGFSGADLLKAGSGDDELEGNPGDDTLNTGGGNDQATGGTGSDRLLGKRGDDTLTGVDPTGLTPGLGEIDTFQGAAGVDVFVLGDTDQAFYDNGKRNAGLKDYALILDLTEEDSIQLYGKRKNYLFQETTGSLPKGTGIYLKSTTGKDELIGIVQNVTDLTLISNTLTFV